MNIAIIGTGKLAHQLAYAISNLKESYHLKTVCGRSRKKAQIILDYTACSFEPNINSLNDHDLIIIAVKDDAIKMVSDQLTKDINALVVHTSGIKDLSIVHRHKKHGIFYPLYSFFNKEKAAMDGVPFLVESNSKESIEILKKLGNAISSNVHEISSEDKKQLHLAAVFANNFSNFMMTNALDILEEKSIDLNILLPIINQSCANWTLGKSKEHQSGPAIRDDKKTMDTHIDKLKTKEQKELYEIISKAIKNYYK